MKSQLLIVMISLAAEGSLTETESSQRENFEKFVSKGSISKFQRAVDGTELHKNFATVLSFSKQSDKSPK